MATREWEGEEWAYTYVFRHPWSANQLEGVSKEEILEWLQVYYPDLSRGVKKKKRRDIINFYMRSLTRKPNLPLFPNYLVKAGGTSVLALPSDIIFSIIVSFDCKTWMRCQLVCRDWFRVMNEQREWEIFYKRFSKKKKLPFEGSDVNWKGLFFQQIEKWGYTIKDPTGQPARSFFERGWEYFTKNIHSLENKQ
eukprot:TRINITY_DN3281_c0_g1_i1.p2 TRINITY_DN3281_c0_g1~~TRINITY_DN3281_c0_g1_i1.p2  ORF type:complete len:194 (-),score=42.87 TRINITY_DN3281_c0_g1_i1:362-943(-)